MGPDSMTCLNLLMDRFGVVAKFFQEILVCVLGRLILEVCDFLGEIF